MAEDRRSIGEAQGRQRARIHNGVEDGDLTHREANRLRERSQDIAQDRREALSDDGRIDRGERRHIRREQRNLNDNIYRERHDAQER